MAQEKADGKAGLGGKECQDRRKCSALSWSSNTVTKHSNKRSREILKKERSVGRKKQCREKNVNDMQEVWKEEEHEKVRMFRQ